MGALGENLQIKYEPIWEQAPVDEKFHYYEEDENGNEVLKIHEENFKLIENIDELKEYIELTKDKIIGFDTETTGLTFGEDKIVGFSLSLDAYSGIYVPIRHKEQLIIKKEVQKKNKKGELMFSKAGLPLMKEVEEIHYKESPANIDPKEALDVLYEILLGAKRVLAHNAEFDMNMLKFEGYDVLKIKFFDTLILPYIFDAEATGLANLKALEKRVLGRTVPEFKDVLGKKAENFSLIAPKDGYVYACYDKETEVLTENGWVFWKDYNGIDQLATFNTEKGVIEYQEPIKLFKYEYNGLMECCESKTVNYCVTPNHNMLVIEGQCNSGKRIKTKYTFKRADNLDSFEYMHILMPFNEIVNIPVRKEERSRKEYHDYVYCAEVPNHTLITRRNGKTLVAGNCCDTSGVVGVYDKMFPEVLKLLKRFKKPLVFDGVPYNVLAKDNKMVKIFVDYYGHAKILIDREKAIKFKEQLQQEHERVTKEIYDYFDKGMFNLSASSKEFKEVMLSKNILTGVLTKKKVPSWSKNAAVAWKRNLNKFKECLDHWTEVDFTTGNLNKKGLGFQLAEMLKIYGNNTFKIKDQLTSMKIKGLKGETIDPKMFWISLKHLYESEIEKLRILSLVHKNNSLNKSMNSYVDKLTQADECYMHYRLKGTKSGRLSSGNGSKSDKRRNKYYIDLNAQNLTKPASAYYKAEECSIDDEEGILGWKFTPLDKEYALAHLEDLYIVEGQDPNITIRGCLKAPKGRYVVSLDYDAEEYRLIAVLSQDSQMLQNFYNGIDPHTASAYAIWGEENYDKSKRKKAKIFNFLNNYSGGAHTLAQQLEISVDEAQDMINKYNKTFHEMVEWKEEQIRLMYENEGIVFNAFGRPRQFKGWINVVNKISDSYETLIEKREAEKASFKVKSAIERRVASHLVQGTAGDILRLVMINLYERYFKDRDPHIDFMSTVHDEINYTIDKEVTVDYIRELEDMMTFDALDKSLPIQTSTDIGYTYGNMFPFVWTDETKTKLIPKRVHHA